MAATAMADRASASPLSPFQPTVRYNWAGCPLETWETILNCVHTTMIQTGWLVTAVGAERGHRAGVKISNEKMAGPNLDRKRVLPHWNYTSAAAESIQPGWPRCLRSGVTSWESESLAFPIPPISQLIASNQPRPHRPTAPHHAKRSSDFYLRPCSEI